MENKGSKLVFSIFSGEVYLSPTTEEGDSEPRETFLINAFGYPSLLSHLCVFMSPLFLFLYLLGSLALITLSLTKLGELGVGLMLFEWILEEGNFEPKCA